MDQLGSNKSSKRTHCVAGRFPPDLRIAVSPLERCITNISLSGLERLVIALSVDVLYIMAHIDTTDLEGDSYQPIAKALPRR